MSMTIKAHLSQLQTGIDPYFSSQCFHLRWFFLKQLKHRQHLKEWLIKRYRDSPLYLEWATANVLCPNQKSEKLESGNTVFEPDKRLLLENTLGGTMEDEIDPDRVGSHRESNNLTINEQPNRNARQTQNESRKCKLLSWEKQVVAEGTVASTDPNCLVHFKKLGPDGCKVWVDVAVDPGAFLWRPNSEMCTIGEAVGSTVAWHKDFLAFD